jgi:hypothetical protein
MLLELRQVGKPRRDFRFDVCRHAPKYAAVNRRTVAA